MTMPKFRFGAAPELTKEEFEKKTSNSTFIAPGSYVMTVTQIDYHVKDGSAACKGDPTFFGVKAVLATVDGRTKNYWLQIPTASILYGQKKTGFIFKKLTEFLAGIGVELGLDNYKTVLPELFKDRASMMKLVGKTVSSDVGYSGNHLKRDNDLYIIVKKDGETRLTDKAFPDAESARAYGDEKGYNLQYPEFTKFHPKSETKPEVEGGAEW